MVKQTVTQSINATISLMFSAARFRIAALLSIALTVFALVGSAKISSARPEFLDSFKQTYTNIKPGGAIDTASCDLCHLNGPPKLNPYGLGVRSALDKAGATSLNGAILKSIESADSDGDGFSNLEEINADTLPGDPKSHPAGKPHAAATAPSGAESVEVSPFDLKSIVFAKHAQHPVIVHLPIGLFIASLLFDLIGRWKKIPGLNSAAYYNLIVGAISAVVAVATGIAAWQWKLGGGNLKGNLLLHLILGIVTALLMLILVSVRRKSVKSPDEMVSTGYLILAIITGLIVALTGHIGGILSGVV